MKIEYIKSIATLKKIENCQFPIKWLQCGLSLRRAICFVVFSAFISCEEFVAIDPPKDQIVTANLFTTDASALSAISGIYGQMAGSGIASGGIRSVTFLAGYSSDELIHYSGIADVAQFYTNSLLANNLVVYRSLWEEGYKYIYYCNSILEGLEKSSGITPATLAQVRGEAKFIRSFCYFYLVNLFGDVPLILTTDYKVNRVAPRTGKSLVYERIMADLQEAADLLPNDFALFGNERIRPTKWAAKALLARVYLYVQDWANAEAQATSVIGNAPTFSLIGNLNNVFLKNSTEAIWQLKPVLSTNTAPEVFFILRAGFAPNEVSLNPQVYTAFEAGDTRRTNWVGSIVASGITYYYPFKYKVTTSATAATEYSMVLRLSEQYLIRAEARAQQGKVAEAITDVDVIRQRARLPLIANTNPSISAANLLLAIERERRMELFAEWGHRWLDLKRTGRADAVLGPAKTPNWKPYQVLYPIPFKEISLNPNLLPQNTGYSN
jgi:starch-binding outer membrane protein, SusD/RagB family